MELKDVIRKLCDDAVKSVERWEKKEHRRKGCLEGIELCRTLQAPADFERVLAERHAKEAASSLRDGPIEEYWRYRCATSQVEYVYEVVKVAVGGYATVSARAVLRYHEITAN